MCARLSHMVVGTDKGNGKLFPSRLLASYVYREIYNFKLVLPIVGRSRPFAPSPGPWQSFPPFPTFRFPTFEKNLKHEP